MRVLIVDQDSVVRREVISHLQLQGVSVTAATTVATALKELDRATFDAAILSLVLPDGSGLEILSMLRGLGSPIHVIVMSRNAGEEDRVGALELGADDFVVKPFFVRELTARVLTAQRRQPASHDQKLTYGRVVIDLATRSLAVRGVVIALTPMEFDLLAFLATRPGHAFSRDDLLRAVWHSSGDWQQEATVTEHMRRLRAKLEPDPDAPHLLRTVRGVGYRFEPPAADNPRPISRSEVETASPTAGTFVVVDGRVMQADAATIEMFGAKTEAELVGRDELELVAPQSISGLRARRDALAAGFSPGSQIVAIRNPDGTDAYAELSSAPTVWNKQPALVKTVRLSLDSGADLRRIVTGVATEMSDAVIVTDPEFHIRSWNDAAQRFYGWAEQEVVGRRIDDVLRIEGSERSLTAAQQALDDQGRWFGALSIIGRDGSTVDVSTSSTVVRDDAGRPVLVTSVHRLSVPSRTPAVTSASVAADEAEIRRALRHDELVAYYQPMVALEARSIVAVEVSARWEHPDLGIVRPAELIDPAEHADASLEIERVVFEQATEQAAIWREAGLQLSLAIHLSNAQLADVTLFDDIAATLARCRLEPSALWVEVTETALVEDIELAAELLHRLAELGVRAVVDNYGIGWASLAYLTELPIHALKIDRHFIADLAESYHDATITRSIISLGKELGLTVIAAGVDTSAQHAALEAMGCEYGQGSLYGTPTTAAGLRVEAVRSS